MINTVRFSIVMPIELKERIDILAKKGLIKRNKWIVRTLAREAKLK
jgi:predicted DNA-binding protein